MACEIILPSRNAELSSTKEIVICTTFRSWSDWIELSFCPLTRFSATAAAVSSGDEIPATPTLIPGSNQSALAPSLPSPSNIGSASSSLPESPPSFQDGALFGSATPMNPSSDAEESEAESTAGRGTGRFEDPGRGLGRVTESQSEGDESVNRGKEAIARAAAARAAVAALKNMSKEGGGSAGETMSDPDRASERSGAAPGENGVHTEKPPEGNLQTGEEARVPEPQQGDDGLHIDMAGLPNVRVPSSQPIPSPGKTAGAPRTASLPPHAAPGPSKLGARKPGEVVGTENRGGVAGTSSEAPPGRPLAHRRQLSTSSDVSTSSWGVGSEASGLEAFDVHGGGLVAVGEMSKELKLALPLDQVRVCLVRRACETNMVCRFAIEWRFGRGLRPCEASCSGGVSFLGASEFCRPFRRLGVPLRMLLLCCWNTYFGR